MLTVLYLVPMLSDPAAERRVTMLEAGGAQVLVAGFQRGKDAADNPPSRRRIVLGRTFNARFVQRLFTVAGAYTSVVGRVPRSAEPDVIIARNLEMLPLAGRLQRAWGNRPALVYECLDIHRLLLDRSAIGGAMRAAERYFARSAGLLLTSSPAFVREYFGGLGQWTAATMLLENKVILQRGRRGTNPALAAKEIGEGPIRIGWFGTLRCRKSLDILTAFTRRMNGRVEVLMRGRPALNEFDDFHGSVDREPHISFGGPYQSSDLADLYSQVHFVWAIDFFEEGLNSKWLLPNRIYEGCLNGAVPIALEGTETAAFLRSIGIGIILPDVAPTTLERLVGGLGPADLRRLAGAVAAVDERRFAFDSSDCAQLVAALSRLSGSPQAMLEDAE